MEFSIIVATDLQRCIGVGGQLPWKLKADLKHFQDITTTTKDSSKRNAVIMGRKTWESLPERARPLPKRLNVVLSRQSPALPEGVMVKTSLDAALEALRLRADVEQAYVIGGGSVYAQAIASPACRRIYLTEIQTTVAGDTFFPAIPGAFEQMSTSPMLTEGQLSFRYLVFER